MSMDHQKVAMQPRLRRPSMCKPVTFSGDDIVGRGIARNITARGCEVCCRTQQVPVGAYLTLDLSLFPRSEPLTVDQVVVRWSKGQAFGLEFVRMSAGVQERLRQFLSTL